MRCDSVLPSEKVTPLSPEELKACGHEGYVVYKDLEEKPQSEVKPGPSAATHLPTEITSE